MRKLFLLILSVCTVLCVTDRARARVRYQGDLYTGFSISAAADPTNRVPLRLVNSLRFGPYFSAGVGVGCDFYLRKREFRQGSSYWGFDGSGRENKNGVGIPVFLNLKGYIADSRLVSFFGSIDLGRTIGAWSMKRQGGFMFTPSVGVSWRLSMGTAVTFGLGFTVQRWKHKLSGGGYTDAVNNNTFNINVGFQF